MGAERARLLDRSPRPVAEYYFSAPETEESAGEVEMDHEISLLNAARREQYSVNINPRESPPPFPVPGPLREDAFRPVGDYFRGSTKFCRARGIEHAEKSPSERATAIVNAIIAVQDIQGQSDRSESYCQADKARERV